jgi:nucleoid DNA-binding protein
MTDKMTKSEWVKYYAEMYSTTQKQAEIETNRFLDALVSATSEGTPVKFVGVFATTIKEVPERDFFNPKDRTQKVTIPAHNKIVIKPGARLVEAAGDSEDYED